VLRAAFRRILVFVAVLVGGTAAVSATLGALAGANILRSLATGYYVIGAAVLIGSFALGVRGPVRREVVENDDEVTPTPMRPLRRRRRKATPEERAESRRSSLGLFALGIAFLLLAAAVDPARSVV
jgi:hypothetical protein